MKEPIEITPAMFRLPDCCLNAADNPDEPCEHVINIQPKKKETNIGLWKHKKPKNVKGVAEYAPAGTPKQIAHGQTEVFVVPNVLERI